MCASYAPSWPPRDKVVDMSAQLARALFTRRAALKAGALMVGFAFAGLSGRAFAEGAVAATRRLDPHDVEAFLAVNADGTLRLLRGKVEGGQVLRIARRQIAGAALGIGVDMIKSIQGDTALTPDQGRTSGSNGIQRRGMQIR